MILDRNLENSSLLMGKKARAYASRKVDVSSGACGSLFLAAFIFSPKYLTRASAKSEDRKRVVLGLRFVATI